MVSSIRQWFNELSPLKQLCILFTVNGLYWYITWHIFEHWFVERDSSAGYQILRATWMAFGWTLLFNWSKFKKAIKR